MEIVIHKEVVAIRYSVIIIFFFCLIKLHAQEEISGKYCVEYQMKDIYKCMSFENDKNFIITEGGDLGKPKTLKGDWRFLGQTLILSYSEPKLQESYKIETASSYTLKDSVSITFKVKDFNNCPTLGLYINILPLNLSLITDENGFAETKLKKSNNIIQGNTEYLGYEDAYFSINLNKNQNIKISINEKNNEVLKKQNDTLNIVILKKDYFKVKEKNGKITVWKKFDK